MTCTLYPQTGSLVHMAERPSIRPQASLLNPRNKAAVASTPSAEVASPASTWGASLK